jgi:hypothetical protein
MYFGEPQPGGANILLTGLSSVIVPRLGGTSRKVKVVGPQASWSPDGSQIVSVYPGDKKLEFTDSMTGAITDPFL